MVSLLRKRLTASRSTSSNQDDPSNLRPSLSLPDLTTPLLDPESWEELPSFTYESTLREQKQNVPLSASRQEGEQQGSGAGAGDGDGAEAEARGGGSTPKASASARGWRRKTSLVGAQGPTPPQFHKPFSPWQIVPRVDVPSRDSDSSSITQDFRTSRARWGTDTIISTANISASGQTSGLDGLRGRRRGKMKTAPRLNVVVVGGKGSGKTSLIDLIYASFSPRHAPTPAAAVAHDPPRRLISPSKIRLPDSTLSSPTVPGPPQADILRSLGSPAEIHSSASDRPESTSPIQSARIGIGITRQHATNRITSRSSVVQVEGYDRVQLRLIDTPGLELGSGDTVREKERERGVAGLMRLIEDQFGEFMSEESRIVRKSSGGDDNLVHIVVYLIDARRVLNPQASEPMDLDWSAVGVFSETDVQNQDDHGQPPAEAHLGETDITILRRLKERANVLPVLSHIDTLTIAELDQVRRVVRDDLQLAFPEDAGFGVFAVQDDVDSSNQLSRLAVSPMDPASPDAGPPTPAALSHCRNQGLPFALFSPSKAGDDMGFTRRYNWGTADVFNSDQCDFLALREAVLGTHTKLLRSLTREVLYEKYRTEKLLARQSAKDRPRAGSAGRGT
ncbi:Septin-domain-containing protein [Kockovaella imperatae]|uniref:Septin-domain-containing protein n=1 Tax=Kockovaella imperatae TaxID=4999 RepID=A0A1Y1U9N7_9TREE|nr:Septin-domain-containing protein [Kockovaella imperatae]ORX33805.1 Septin-domain-containing protein [Kockovaella imperatae]